MSYILDALKKSEAQRHAGRVPTVAAPHGVQIEPPRASRLGLFVWIAVALALALGAGWWARRYSDRPLSLVAVSTPVDPSAPTLPQAAVDATAPLAAESAKGKEAIPRLKLAVSLPPREQPAPAPSADAPPKAVVQSPSAPASAPVPAREAPPPTPSRAGVVAYSALPPAIRQGLPPLVIGGFAAGDSGATLVMVDDKLVREGDEVAPGIRVEKILADTAEFSYKGYRFRR